MIEFSLQLFQERKWIDQFNTSVNLSLPQEKAAALEYTKRYYKVMARDINLIQ